MKALISVYDKTGLEELCKSLELINCDIYSTGGTLKHIKNMGFKVHSIFKITKFFKGNFQDILFVGAIFLLPLFLIFFVYYWSFSHAN